MEINDLSQRPAENIFKECYRMMRKKNNGYEEIIR